MAILYGNKCIKEDRVKESYRNYQDLKKAFEDNLGIYLNETGIYDKIYNSKLEESVGVYYQEEASVEDVSGGSGNENTTNVPDANKTIKRVITYNNYSIPTT